MKVTFIHHSSFFVDKGNVCFLFDYWKGTLPEPMEAPLFIFVSHGHKDHFNPEIFAYGNKWKQVHWIISNDISIKEVPAYLMNNITVVSPGEDYTVTSGNITIKFSTLKSTDMGVAYLISSNDETLYYAGDLHLWVWREDTNDDMEMQRAFEKEMEKLRGLKIIAAFLPLDPRQKQDAFLGLDYTARLVDIKRIYPMHCWQKFRIIDKLNADACSEPYRDRICQIREDGFTDEI